jgi:FtsP/CotA-like multicopper oxidase with cupredoxin domain
MTGSDLNRRRFLTGAAGLALPFAAARAEPALAQRRPDYQLSIGIVNAELAPGNVVQTIGYNGSIPGPVIRVREGQRVTIEVVNELCGIDDIVHWHGLTVPSNVDGAMEEGSPMVSSAGRHTFSFVAQPAGTRWYHSHAIARTDLTRSLYSGQYGFFLIEPKTDPARYDREELIVLHQWQPSWVILQDLRKGPPADNGLEVAYMSASVNGHALGSGPPIAVRQGQRVLFRVLNANATMDASLALPGHRFTVVALDGNPVPKPQTVDVLYIAPGERVDAVVEMNQPGVWVFGSTQNAMRMMGMGTVVEYAGASGEAVWQAPPPSTWDYTAFGTVGVPRTVDGTFTLNFDKIPGGRGGYNQWTINGKSWPETDSLRVARGKRYRMVLNNPTGDMHTIHLHRHRFEITNWLGTPTAGVYKDVVALPGRKSGEIEFVADNPGPSLFHCHMQDHQDFGFMALVEYVL